MRSRTKVGFHPEGDGSQTYAFRSMIYLSTRSFVMLPSHLSFPTLPGTTRTLGASHNTTSFRGDVDTCDCLIMPLQFILQCKLATGAFIELNMILSGHAQCLSVSGEGMISNGVMEEMVNFGRRHGFWRWMQ